MLPVKLDLDPGEGDSPDSFFPSFRPAVAELTNRGNGKVCFMKTKTSTTRNLVSHAPLRLAFLLVPLAFAGFALSSTAWAGDGRSENWRQAAFDPAHTAFNRGETILSPANVGNLTQAWASPVGTFTLFASPVVCGGKVFIGGDDGHMYALDATTGATVWVGPTQASFFVDSAAVGHRLVFANSIYSTLLAYDAETGAIAWTSNLTDVRASPTLSNGTLYVASNDGTLTALDAETGTPLWSRQGGCCVYDQAPAVDGGRVFQMRTDHTLTGYDARTGRQLWSTSAFSVGTLAASGGVLFFNEYPNVIALDEATGTQLWASPVLALQPDGAPAVANGLVFVTTTSLMALDAATGAV